MKNRYASPGATRRFGHQNGISVPIDEDRIRNRGDSRLTQQQSNQILPGLLLFGEHHQPSTPVTQNGVEYDFSQIDYLIPRPSNRSDVVLASRMIARVLAGNHVERAYWTQQAHTQEISAHRGIGTLIVAQAASGLTETVKLDARRAMATATIQPGCFYTVAAAADTPEPLVLSSFFDSEIDWDELEITVKPGESSIETPEGIVPVPEQFQTIS